MKIKKLLFEIGGIGFMVGVILGLLFLICGCERKEHNHLKNNHNNKASSNIYVMRRQQIQYSGIYIYCIEGYKYTGVNNKSITQMMQESDVVGGRTIAPIKCKVNPNE